MARGPLREALRLRWIRLDPTSYWRYYQWKRGLAEPEIALFPALCRRDAISIDIGGNIGLYTHPLLQHSAQCIVFEPLPPLARLLERAFRHAGERFHVEQVALSDQSGHAELRMPKGNFGYTTMEPANQLTGKVDTRQVITYQVETKRLDDYGFNNVGFLKIDVEGHESSVLFGARETLERHRPTLLVEVEERHKPGSVAAVQSFMQDLGYAGFYLKDSHVREIASFDLSVHQNELHPQDYIRNFLFLPKQQHEALLGRLHEQLRTATPRKER